VCCLHRKRFAFVPFRLGCLQPLFPLSLCMLRVLFFPFLNRLSLDFTVGESERVLSPLQQVMEFAVYTTSARDEFATLVHIKNRV